MTQIEWTHMPGFKGETWNPVVGCQIVSKGCTNCYAMRQAARLLDGNPKTPHYAGTTRQVNGQAVWTGKIGMAPDTAFNAPLRAKAPRCYFVNSMGDLFAEGVPDGWIDRAFAVMALTPQHRYLILTKRPDRMRAYLSAECRGREITAAMFGLRAGEPLSYAGPWPLKNVWLGVSVEDQAAADSRIPDLLATPAAVRFISAEPLLGPVDLTSIRRREAEGFMRPLDGRLSRIDWVIAGGESGKGARPMHPDWARGLRDQCAAAGVAFFLKQWGQWLPIYDRDREDPDWQHVGEAERLSPKGRWLNLEGGHGFHGERVVRVDRVGKTAAGARLDGVEHRAFPALRDAGDARSSGQGGAA